MNLSWITKLIGKKDNTLRERASLESRGQDMFDNF